MTETTAETPPPKTFIGEYVKWDKSLIKDEASAALVYDSFCRFMQHWMINENQPVDIGFAKVYALMARINFPVVVYNRCVDNQNNVPNKHTQKVICENLTHENMSAWDLQRNSFMWNLFVVPSDSFRSTYRALEEAKKEADRWVRPSRFYYYEHAVDQLRRQLPNAYEVYRTFIKEAQHPFLVLPHSGQGRRNWDAFGAIRKKVGHAPSLLKQPVVIGASLDAGTAQVVATADAEVLPLRDFLQREEDVRQVGASMDEPGRQDGTTRLPLRDVCEGVDADKLLVSGPSGAHAGLGLGAESEQLPATTGTDSKV